MIFYRKSEFVETQPFFTDMRTENIKEVKAAGFTVMKEIKFEKITLGPVIAAILALILDTLILQHSRIPAAETSYFRILMIILLVIFCVLLLRSFIYGKYRKTYVEKVKFITVLICFINLVNIITTKTDLLPLIYFPGPDNILKVFVVDWKLLLTCMLYSLQLFITGVISGGISGIATGIAIGWSKKLNYWIFPPIRFIGPIPPTIWIPIALLVFPTIFGASAFIIALSMWFPTTVLTSSGILNIPRVYFEAASTLGANTRYQIMHIAIPASLPSVFVGIFYGVTSSFMALMVAEMIGVKYGIGWYINWQQQTMSFANVYAALLLIALMCFYVLKLLFRLRDKILGWQKGTIRW
jgi:NitT/TauT family transport system permease protein